MPIIVDIDVLMAKRKLTVSRLAQRVGISPANLAVLKNGRAKAVRFSTLEALCEALDCQPGDLLRHVPAVDDEGHREEEDPPDGTPLRPGPTSGTSGPAGRPLRPGG